MSFREARREITQLKQAIVSLYPDTILKEGPGFEGGPKEIYLYAYSHENEGDAIREMTSARVLDILLKTGVYVHLIPLRPGSMTWLWDNGKKRKPRRVAARKPRAVAETRAQYKTRQPAARRKK